VQHQRLLTKLHYRITGKLLNWIKSFLEHREMRMVVNGHCSSWTQVIVEYHKDLWLVLCCFLSMLTTYQI